jgi:putative flippase GtrA
MFLTNPKERTRFLKFAFVGIIGAVIDFGVFNLLLALTPIPSIWASAISFILAVVSNFIWNRYWTYPDARGKSISHQLVQFSIVSLLGLGIRIGLFAILENFFINLSGRLITVKILDPKFVGHNMTLAIAILVVMLWNFFANRYWTYNEIQ